MLSGAMCCAKWSVLLVFTLSVVMGLCNWLNICVSTNIQYTILFYISTLMGDYGCLLSLLSVVIVKFKIRGEEIKMFTFPVATFVERFVLLYI